MLWTIIPQDWLLSAPDGWEEPATRLICQEGVQVETDAWGRVQRVASSDPMDYLRLHLRLPGGRISGGS